MFMLEYRALSWWYWLATVCFLTAGLAGWQEGFLLAVGVTAMQLAHFVLRKRSLAAFPVQVRLAYLLMLLIALTGDVRLLFWAQAIGTWALVLFGYCPLARAMSLLPWNRTEAFSLGLVRRTVISAPVRGTLPVARA